MERTSGDQVILLPFVWFGSGLFSALGSLYIQGSSAGEAGYPLLAIF